MEELRDLNQMAKLASARFSVPKIRKQSQWQSQSQ